jgi:hypothetical protein
LPQENQKFSFIDLKGNVVNSGKAAKFLAEVSYSMIALPFPERKEFCPVLFGFLDCSCCWFYTLQGFRNLARKL